MGHEVNYSNEVAAKIDHEVRRIVDAAHTEAREILTLHRATLDRLAAALVERETLDEEDLLVIFGNVADGAQGVQMPSGPGLSGPLVGGAAGSGALGGAAGSGALRAERTNPPDPRPGPESGPSLNQEHP